MSGVGGFLAGAPPRANPAPMPPWVGPQLAAAARDYERAAREYLRAVGDNMIKGDGGKTRWLVYPSQVRTDWLPRLAARAEPGGGQGPLVAIVAEFAAQIRAAMPAQVERAARERAEEAAEAAWEGQAYDLDAPTRRGMAGRLVWFYHGTSTALLGNILSRGLLVEPPRLSWDDSSPGWTYLAIARHRTDVYERKAAATHGGDGVTLRLVVPWSWTAPDLDDADVVSGRWQRRVGRDLGPAHIFEVLRGSGYERVRKELDPSRPEDEWARWHESPNSRRAARGGQDAGDSNP